jgi:hypothetical protein
MPRAEEPSPPYEVHNSGVVFQALQRLQRLAAREGRRDKFLWALRQVHQRLRWDPTGFGEPLYQLPALRIEIRHGAIRPLFVDFAVCQDRPLVFIRGVALLPEKEP